MEGSLWACVVFLLLQSFKAFALYVVVVGSFKLQKSAEISSPFVQKLCDSAQPIISHGLDFKRKVR